MVFEDSNIASKKVAREIADLIINKQLKNENCVLGLATGSSPITVYKELVNIHMKEKLSFSNVITFNLDEYYPIDPNALQSYVKFMDEQLFNHIDIKPETVKEIINIEDYNQKEGLALSNEEVKYLENLSKKINRNLTDSEVFGFSQVNSEHCRHKIFNGKFIINNQEMSESLFDLIKKTTKLNPNNVVSAYKDNVAFINGPLIQQFAPEFGNKPSIYRESKFKSIIS